MELTTAKEVLNNIGYPAQGDDWEEVIADLQQTHGATRVGSSMTTLGDAAPLFMKAGNVAHMVDHPNDLARACRQIKSALDQRKAMEPVKLKVDEKSRFLRDILQALENEVSMAERLNRDLSKVDDAYLVDGALGRRLLRNTAQVMDDLLSTDKKRNAKAVEALQALLVIKRAEVS